MLLDKPEGVSSFQALRPLKRLFPKTKIGHAGTLDPMASGLLLIGIGSGTRLLEYLEGMPKTYSFTARFGFTSDSYDMEGAVEPFPVGATGAYPPLNEAAIAEALDAFRGSILQTPPVYSAIKIGGERACDRVRAGEIVTLSSRAVTIHSLRLISFSPGSASETSGSEAETSDNLARALRAPCAVLEMTCSKGTYVRSLVHDLGLALGSGAVADKIRRTAIGPFRVEAASPPESLAPDMELLPLESAVAHLPAGLVPDDWVARFLNGQSVPGPYADPAGSDVRALDATGRLLAIATLSPGGQLSPRKVLVKA